MNDIVHNNNPDTSQVSSLFDSLACPAHSFCEGYSEAATPRSHWQSLFSALGEKTLADFEADHDRVRRMRHEDGATINPFDDLTEQTTAWALDMIPFPLSGQQWDGIEAGIIQRARLLEAILKDTYGSQDLLKSKKIPPELVFANPNFLHQCHGIIPSGNKYLPFYAADIYRASDGQFRVLRDYGSKPAGLGFALENRIVMSRLHSRFYHSSHIRRLAPFFHVFQQAISKRLSFRRENPGIVLLSPGPGSHLYFEHAMLSRYLGYQLVEGQDLTVRNGNIFLKKLTGLEPVEAIFRHIDDNDSDPFALRNKTVSGVAGLLQVCREQNIDIVNPIGCGFVDSPVLKCFLPELCRDVLGQELLLANHPTWWCGNDDGMTRLHEHGASFTVESAMRYDAQVDAQQNDVLAAVQASPAEYLLSAPVEPSTVPSWGENGPVGSYCMLRVFACATEHGFTVLPGGLAITSPDIKTLLSTNPEQQQSKDIWVISEKPVEPFSMMAGFSSIPKFKRNSDLPNRVADNLLWLGRYLERSEGLIQLLRPAYACLAGEDRPEDVPELIYFFGLLNEKRIVASELDVKQNQLSDADLFKYLGDILHDKTRPGSVVSMLRNVRQTAHNVRDRLSIDSTRIIDKLENFRKTANDDPFDLLDQTLFTLSAFSGLAMESMTRGLGWRFMDMGRRLERAINIASLIRLSLNQLQQCEWSFNILQALLRVSDSLMTYRGRYRSAFQVAPVLDLLITDEGNPKSLAFQAASLADHVEYLPGKDERRFASLEERIALEVLTSVRLLDLTDIHCGQEQSDFDELSSFLATTEKQLKDFAQQVTAHYLTQVPTTPHYSMIPDNRSA